VPVEVQLAIVVGYCHHVKAAGGIVCCASVGYIELSCPYQFLLFSCIDTGGCSTVLIAAPKANFDKRDRALMPADNVDLTRATAKIAF